MTQVELRERRAAAWGRHITRIREAKERERFESLRRFLTLEAFCACLREKPIEPHGDGEKSRWR